jgi:hypothetical protein
MTLIPGLSRLQWIRVQLFLKNVYRGRSYWCNSREEDITTEFVTHKGCHDSEEDCCVHD